MTSFVSSVWWNPFTWFQDPEENAQQEGKLFIIDNPKEWNVLKSTGEEKDLIFWTANAKDKKTEIGWIPNDNSCSGRPQLKLYDENNNLILDDKNKEITLKCESSKCDGQNCYHISLTNAQAVNINEYVKLGENSFIVEYQNLSKLEYKLNWSNVNITIFKNISNSWNNTVNELFVYYNEDNYKFGANDSAEEEGTLNNYKYQLKSSTPIYKQGNILYVKNPEKKSEGNLNKITYYETHEFQFNDICSRAFNPYNTTEEIDGENYTITEYNQTAQCSFNSYEEVIDENTTNYFYEVTFISDKNIDPTITISASDWGTTSLLTNVTLESGDTNFTHLNVSDVAPYDSLVGYWNADGDLEDTEGATAYDWSGEGNDGTMNGNATATSGGVYGDVFEFDGDGDYVDLGSMDAVHGIGGLTVSAWVYANPVSADKSYHIVAKAGSGYDTFQLYWGDTHRVYFRVWDTSHSSHLGNFQQGIPSGHPDKWYHVVGVYNGTNVLVYVDGVIGATNVYMTGLTDTADMNADLGSYNGGAYPWNGSIDEVMIFNTSLSEAQVQAIYNNQSARFKNTGTQKVRAEKVTNASTWDGGGFNRVNLSASFEREMGSNVSARVGQMNASVDLTGLVLYMPFEWGSAVDISGEGNDGTVVDAVFNETGGLNESGGFEFDGDGDYVDISNPGNILDGGNLTVSAWAYWNSDANSWPRIVDREFDGQFSFQFTDASNGLAWSLATADGNIDRSGSTTVIGLSQKVWIHVALTYNGSDACMYVNGTLRETYGTGIGGGLDSSSSDIRIGERVDIGGGTRAFNGSIDEVMIFNRSLSADEITALYNNQSAKHNVAYYTDYQNLSGSGENTTFSISTEADFVFPDFKFYSGNESGSQFYSPVLFGDVVLDVYSEGGAGADTSFTVSLPIGYTQINFSANNKTVTNLNAGGQNSTLGVLYLTNTGDVGLDIYLLINETASGFSTFFDTDNDPSGAIVLNSTNQLLKDNLASSSSQNIFGWANWTDQSPQTVVRKLNASVQEN